MRIWYPGAAFLIFLSLCCYTTGLSAQGFKLMRFDENYEHLKDSVRTGYQILKFIPLSKDNKSFLSFGGEMRTEYGGKFNEDWINDQGYNASLLRRYAVHADLQINYRLRVFAQLNSALENGSKYVPAPVDEDQLVMENLFADWSILKTKTQQLSLRLGRQEINYGSGRLISVREGTTARQYFTGAKLWYEVKDFKLDAFVLASDEVKPGVFDNQVNHQANLWGVYANRNIPKSGNFDFYYLGIRRDDARFEEGIAKELRHTIATRYWKNGGGFIYNLEAAYQFGHFGTGTISAWTAAIDFGYTFENLKFKPSLNLRNDYISGDEKAGDGNLQTFNPLYPKGGYFGFNPLIGPSNLIDLHPYLILTLSDRLMVQTDLVMNWRYSIEDGLYRPSGNFSTAGASSDRRYIGTTYLLSAEYSFNKFLTLSCGGQYFQAGNFIKSILPSTADSKYFNLQLSFKF
jgi:hypothetical protein